MNKYKNPDVFDLKYYSQKFSKEVELVASAVIDDPKFSTWWGGLRGQHHDFAGGLAKHTREVVDLCFSTKKTLNLEVDRVELFLSALFHDAGKMYDYKPMYDEFFPDTEFIATPHKRIIHHISRSALIWSHAVTPYKELCEKYHDNVLHNILAHHGQRDWGSPVAPKTQCAWLTHLYDNISARMNDCDRLDLVHGKPKS